MRFSGIIAITHITVIQLFLSLSHNSLKSNFQHFPIFYSNMSYSIVEIITRCENIVFDRSDCFRCHIGSSKLAGCFSLPVLICLPQFSLSFLCDFKWICCSCCNSIQFSLQPFIREFRECLASSWCDRTTSYDQFIITDNNRNIAKNMGKSFRSAGNNRFSFRFLIGFRDQLRSGRLDHWHICI